MKGSSAEIIVKYLEQEGVEFLFGVPGGHLLPLYDALYKNGNIKPILAKHEAGAAFMAYGYAVTSRKIGVCCGTVGPGATNLVTGIASAYTDSVPVLALTAQVGTTAIGKGALQEGVGVSRTVNHVALFDKITKLSTMELRGENIPGAIRRALRVAQSGRPGPVHMDLPADVQGERIDVDILPVATYRPLMHGTVELSQIKAAGNYLSAASKPAILVGYGAACSSGGSKQIVELAERLGAPVATSLRAKGFFPEDHPLALGCVGLYGTRAANSRLRSGVDVLLSIGASFHEFTSHCWDNAFIPSTALIQVDIDPTEIGKNYPVTLALIGDASIVIEALMDEIAEKHTSGDDIIAFKDQNDYFSEDVMLSDAVPVKPQRLMKELRNALPRDASVFVDIGNTLSWAERYFQAYSEGRFIALSGLAAMGSATAACIGGKLGRPNSPTVCLCGDGSFQMTGMEVATAAAHGIPVIWVILKDNRLGMIHDIQSVSFQNRYISATLPDTDFVLLARSLGGKGYRIEKPSEIGSTLKQALQQQGPVVIEVIIDSNEIPPMKPRMMALRRSVGLPDPMKSFSWDGIKALWQMVKER
jgi:acetolactate synthase-1/2/3 large subunit